MLAHQNLITDEDVWRSSLHLHHNAAPLIIGKRVKQQQQHADAQQLNSRNNAGEDRKGKGKMVEQIKRGKYFQNQKFFTILIASIIESLLRLIV